MEKHDYERKTSFLETKIYKCKKEPTNIEYYSDFLWRVSAILISVLRFEISNKQNDNGLFFFAEEEICLSNRPSFGVELFSTKFPSPARKTLLRSRSLTLIIKKKKKQMIRNYRQLREQINISNFVRKWVK